MFIVGEARGCVRGHSGKKKKKGRQRGEGFGEGGEERKEREKEIGEREGERQPDGERERGRCVGVGGVVGWSCWVCSIFFGGAWGGTCP